MADAERAIEHLRIKINLGNCLRRAERWFLWLDAWVSESAKPLDFDEATLTGRI